MSRFAKMHSVFLLLVIALAVAGSAHGQDNAAPADASASTESFAGTFFVSKAAHADGSQTLDVFGTILIWTLLAMSIVNIGLIGFLALTNQRKSIVPRGVVSEIRKLLSGGNYRRAIEITQSEQSFFSRVIHAGLNDANHGYNAMIRSMEQTADVLTTTRMRPVEVLYMFGQISPMMGLLGTVYGIIFAFRVFVEMGGRASPALLAGGIGTALVATFWGLVVAIPALAGYSILRNKVDQLTLEALTSAEDMLAQFKPKTAIAAAANAQRTNTPTPQPVPAVKPVQVS